METAHLVLVKFDSSFGGQPFLRCLLFSSCCCSDCFRRLSSSSWLRCRVSELCNPTPLGPPIRLKLGRLSGWYGCSARRYLRDGRCRYISTLPATEVAYYIRGNDCFGFGRAYFQRLLGEVRQRQMYFGKASSWCYCS